MTKACEEQMINSKKLPDTFKIRDVCSNCAHCSDNNWDDGDRKDIYCFLSGDENDRIEVIPNGHCEGHERRKMSNPIEYGIGHYDINN